MPTQETPQVQRVEIKLFAYTRENIGRTLDEWIGRAQIRNDDITDGAFAFELGDEAPEAMRFSALFHLEVTVCLAETPFIVAARIKDGMRCAVPPPRRSTSRPFKTPHRPGGLNRWKPI